MIIDVELAQERIEELLDRASAGEEILISIDGVARVRIQPIPAENEQSTTAAPNVLKQT